MPSVLKEPIPRARTCETVVLGGLTAALIDIIDAVVVGGMDVTRVLQTIASGLLGPSAFHGGNQTAALGLALHIFIALSAAAVYLGASRRWQLLIRRPVVSGLIFGLCVWAFMHIVVLPLSLFEGGMHSSPATFINQSLIHALGVGLPIALFASRSARELSKQR